MLTTLFTGQNLIELSESPSVNTHAIELLKAVKLAEGTVIYTKKQTQGRGQRGNTWLSEHGRNLTMCIVWHPNFLSVANSFLLSMTVSLGLYDLLTDLLTEKQQVKIKWPNDMYVDGKKVAGILIENVLRDDRLASSVVGIGLNLNQENFGALNEKAISLKNLTGKEFSIEESLKQLCNMAEARYLQLRNIQPEKIKEEYLSHLLFLNEERDFGLQSGGNLRGKITDVALSGRLLVETSDGKKRDFDFKELIF